MRAHGLRAHSPSQTFASTLLLTIVAVFGSLLPVRAQATGQTVQLAGPAAQQTDRVNSAIQAQVRTQISGHRPAWTASAADLGTIPDTTPLQLVFHLSRSPEVQAAFDQLTVDQQNPASPRFHQWLTPQQVGNLYGPTQHDLDALTTWLTGQGFQIDLIQPNRIFIQVSAPAAVVSAALQTSVHTYARPSGNLRAPATEPTVPAAFGNLVQFIGGLTDVPMHTHSHQTQPILNTQTNIHSPVAGVSQTGSQIRPDMALGSGTNFIAPADFAVLYDLNPAYNSGIKGSGQRVMIIGGSRLNPSDLSYWESLTGLPAYTPNYIVGSAFTDPGITYADKSGDIGEGTLDFERVYATAPSATIDQVIALNWLSGTVNFQLISYAINTVNDPVLTMSFSACEVGEPTGFVQQESTLFQQAASQGISVFASSGDSGVDGCEQQGVAAQATQVVSISDICASPYVTCVGGTEFNDAATSTYWSSTNGSGYESALSYIPEGGWNEPYSYNSSGVVTGYIISASGGGFSTIIAKPTWQTGTGVPADGARDVPDVSFSASGHNAYFACLASSTAVGASSSSNPSCVPSSTGQFYLTGFSGTSASAPSMAGIAAMLDQKLGSRQGNLNPMLYKMFNATPNVFHDATIASSGVSGCTTATPSLCNNSNPSPTALTGGIAGYLLQTGYDEVTGLGSLDVSKFLTAAISTSTTITASPTTIIAGQTVQFTATVSNFTAGTATGTVVFSSNGTPITSALTLVNGAVTSPSISFPAAGTYTITAVYSGDTTFTGSNGTSSFIVTPAPTTTVLLGTSAAITTQQTVGYTATISSTASGTPTGTVQFVRTAGGTSVNLGSPVAVSGGKATLAPVSVPAGTYTVTGVYSGDTAFATSTSASVSLVVNPVGSATSISGVPATVTAITAITPVATVGPASGITGTPTGSVQFYVDSNKQGGAVPLSGTTATAGTFYLAPGSHTVTATYSGDTIFASSSASAPTTSSVVATSIAFTPTPPATQATTATTLTATVSGLSSAVATTGTVKFMDGTATLATAAVNASTGVASASVTLSGGLNALTAVFAGDTNYASSSTPAVNVTVPTFTLSAGTSSLTLASASSASGTDVITAATTNGYTGMITFGCSLALSSGGSASVAPGCTASPSSITGPGTTTVNLTTIAPHAIGSQGVASLAPLLTGSAVSLAGLFGLFLPGLAGLRRKHQFRALLSVFLLAGVFFGLSGCGGSKPAPSGGTTIGTYTVTVTGTSSTGIPAVTTTFSLTVN